MQAPKALILGATGHCGKALTNHLLAESYYSQIAVVVRKELTASQESELLSDDFVNIHKKPSSSTSPLQQQTITFEARKQKLKQIIVPKFEEIVPALDPSIGDYEAIFCCLGSSTLVQGWENFKQIDKETPLAVAKLALSKPTNQLHRFSIITCGLSSADSWNSYLRIKGETEDGLRAMEIPQFSAFHPAGITGRNEPWAETAIKRLFGFLETAHVVNSNYGNIDARDLGVSMGLHDAELRGRRKEKGEKEARIVTVAEMRRLVKEGRK